MSEDNRVPLAVTVSTQVDPVHVAQAKQLARQWGLPFVMRPRKTGLDVLLNTAAESFLVLGSDGWTLRDREGTLQWSPNMAWLRIKRIDNGERDDHLVRLCELKQGDHVLDCTLGLAQDALVCSRVVGPSGRVVGVEHAVPLWILASQGLAAWDIGNHSARVTTLLGDSADLLETLDDQSFDCVLFDPMFEKPKKSSPGFEVLRRYATDAPLSSHMLAQARRVARRWVVVKSARYTPALKNLGLTPEPTSRYSSIVWARVPGGKKPVTSSGIRSSAG